MGFFKQTFAAAAAMTSLAAARPTMEKRDDACSSGKWVGPNIVGGNGGGAMCETQWGGKYQPITGLEVWTDNNRIRGVKATYADQTVGKIWGQQDSTATASISVDYSKGDRFTTVTSYGTGDGKELGHMYIEASNGQKLDIGKPTKGITPYQQNVGGGILLGLVGNAGSDINAMGYLFLNADIDHIEIGDMQFNDPPTGNDNMQPVILSQQHYYNDQQSGNVSWSFTGQQVQQSTQTYSQATTGTFGMKESIEVSGEVFGIGAKSTTDFNWEVSHTTTSTTSTMNGITLSWQEGGSLAPGKGVDCTASVQKGQGDFQYTATVTMFLKGGDSYSYQESGTLQDTAFSSAYVTVKDDDSQSASQGISTGTVDTSNKVVASNGTPVSSQAASASSS